MRRPRKQRSFLLPILYKMDFMKGNVVLVKVDYFSILVSWLHEQIVKKSLLANGYWPIKKGRGS